MLLKLTNQNLNVIKSMVQLLVGCSFLIDGKIAVQITAEPRLIPEDLPGCDIFSSAIVVQQ